MIHIGIDAGAHTGVAVWSSARKEFLAGIFAQMFREDNDTLF